eukprot:m.256060 g.256060  ORF g.256060 m.256060 type:complete len:100 (+) comp34033_c0_seq1:93-392(+)
MSDLEFNQAVYLIRNGPKAESSNEVKLNYYKFFKQAKDGDVTGSQPYSIQFEARAKWDAWNSVKGMSKEDAQKAYVAQLTEADPSWKENDVLNAADAPK